MGRVVYDVPLVRQETNLICWVACTAMVASERLGYSIGVGNYAHGFDPSNSNIPDPASDYDEKVRRMNFWGFDSILGMDPTNDAIEGLLRAYGPFILWHYCSGFPYGYSRPITDPTAEHAVVITGFDSAVGEGTCWMNNPWRHGQKDHPLPASAVRNAIARYQIGGYSSVFYYRPS